MSNNGDSNLYAEVSTSKNNIVEKSKRLVQKYLIYIVLLFNIALQVVSKLYQIGLTNPFTIEFCLELIISTITTMICYFCFIPFGKADEKKRNPSIDKNIETWTGLTEKVRKGFNDAFRIFCFEQVEYERKEARELILGNNTLISYDAYVQKYLGKDKAQIKKLVEKGEISKREAKAINRANGYGLFNPTKIKPINPIIILSGVKKQTMNDAGRADSSYIAKWLAKRPLMIFASTTAINAISTTFIGSENCILEMLLAVLTIIIASICGYSAGQEDVKEQNDRVMSRILFLSLFEEKKMQIVKSIEQQKNAEKIEAEEVVFKP